MNPISCSIWLFLVTKFIYLLSKGGPVSRWNCYCTFSFFFFITLWPQLHKAGSSNCPHTGRILWRSTAVPQTTYGTANWIARAGVMESGLPKHQQSTAELRYPVGQLCSQASDLCILWSPNLHTWLLVKQALRTISPGAFRCLDSQTGIPAIPQSFYLCL